MLFEYKVLCQHCHEENIYTLYANHVKNIRYKYDSCKPH